MLSLAGDDFASRDVGLSIEMAYSQAAHMFIFTCCLDSKLYAVIVFFMRTTVTIDSDTEHLLRKEAARTGRSFKVVLNQAIRYALSKAPAKPIRVETLFSAPFPAELEAMSMNRLADELDDEETIRELAR